MKSVVLLLAFSLLALFPVAAQTGDCGDPFAGVTVRFDASYWDSTDFCLHSVPYDEIRPGGPPPDGIPPIDHPVFESIASAQSWLQAQSPVIMVEVNGKGRAYPLAIMLWHQVVNDVLGGEPVVVTYCPLCNNAAAFSRNVNSETLTFGVSGNLRNSNLIMWDRQSQSWWQQFTGEGIVGTHTGTTLQLIPAIVTGFGDFAWRFPEGEVLSRDTSYLRDYGGNPYENYDKTTQPFMFEGELDPRLPPTTNVLAGIIEGQAVAYPFTILSEQRVINDTVGSTNVVALWQWGVASALGRPRIDESEQPGWAALYNRVIQTPDGEITLTFRLTDDGYIRDYQTESSWNVFGMANDGPLGGTQLELLTAAPSFWFTWATFQPDTRVYELRIS